MNWVRPKILKKGDTVGIFAPSDWFSRKHFDEGVRTMESWGLRVKLSNHLFDRVEDFMAGSVEKRAADLRELIFDDEVKALWAAEGGYAAPELRFCLGEREIKHLGRQPKWLIGYSDVGVLTNALFAHGLVSVCGPNVCGLTDWKRKSQEWLRRIIMGGGLAHPKRGRVLVEGEASGIILASNLDSLVSNFGTRYDPLLQTKERIILLVEEWKEDLSRLQRHFEAIFDHVGFDRVGALILGRLSLLREESYPKWAMETDVYELLTEKLGRRTKIPLAVVDYFGHRSSEAAKERGSENNLAWINGTRMELTVKKTSGSGMGKVIFSCLEEQNF